MYFVMHPFHLSVDPNVLVALLAMAGHHGRLVAHRVRHGRDGGGLGRDA